MIWDDYEERVTVPYLAMLNRCLGAPFSEAPPDDASFLDRVESARFLFRSAQSLRVLKYQKA